MIWLFFLLAISIVLLFISGEITVRGAMNLAQMLQIPPTIVGLLILSFGTSLPELFVSIEAALNNQHNLLVGNIIGSNVANTLLVLGLVAVTFSPLIGDFITKINAWIAFSASVLFVLFLVDEKLSYLEAGLLVIAGLGFTALNFFYGQKEPESDVSDHKTTTHTRKSLITALFTLILGFVLLPVSADLLIHSASDIARTFNIDEGVIGITVIALGTSLPELTTSLVAAIKKENDLSIGNIIGSNIFNILVIGGISGLFVPLVIGFYDLLPHLIVMTLVITIPIWFILADKAVSKISGWSMFLCYAIYIAFVVQSVL